MWTAANRKSYERKGLRYPSDMTEAEWLLVKLLVDVPPKFCREECLPVSELDYTYILGETLN